LSVGSCRDRGLTSIHYLKTATDSLSNRVLHDAYSRILSVVHEHERNVWKNMFMVSWDVSRLHVSLLFFSEEKSFPLTYRLSVVASHDSLNTTRKTVRSIS